MKDVIAAIAATAHPIAIRGGLETTNTDADFIEISVWEIRRLLEAAYEAGKEAAE